MPLKPPDGTTDTISTWDSLADRVDVLEEDSRFHVRNYSSSSDPVQAAVTAASAFGGGEVVLDAGVWVRPANTPLTIPNFVTLRGHGQSSIIRANGNHYAISLAPANRTRLSNFMIESVSTQSSGGGIDYTSAGSNTSIDHIYFSSGLHTSINLTPAAVTSVHHLDSLRWNGGVNYNTAIKIGDGTNLVTDIMVRHCKGTAATNNDMQLWWDISRKVDTLTIEDCLNIKGQAGMVLGSRGAAGNVTGLAVDKLILDQTVGIAIDCVNVLDASFGSECMIQTCGTTPSAALRCQSGVLMLSYFGTIRNCGGDGVTIADGSKQVRLLGARIYDNNTSNTANLSGITVEANADLWEIIGCWIGNNVLATGHQKYGVNIAAGNSNLWTLLSNYFYRNETLPLNDGATGALKCKSSNYAIDAAGTANVAVDDIKYGGATYRDTAGADRILINSNGWQRWVGAFAANPVLDVRGTSAQTAQLALFQRSTTVKSQVNSQGAFVSDDSAQGIVLKDNAGTPHYWRVTVSAAGALATTDLGTTRPD